MASTSKDGPPAVAPAKIHGRIWSGYRNDDDSGSPHLGWPGGGRCQLGHPLRDTVQLGTQDSELGVTAHLRAQGFQLLLGGIGGRLDEGCTAVADSLAPAVVGCLTKLVRVPPLRGQYVRAIYHEATETGEVACSAGRGRSGVDCRPLQDSRDPDWLPVEQSRKRSVDRCRRGHGVWLHGHLGHQNVQGHLVQVA